MSSVDRVEPLIWSSAATPDFDRFYFNLHGPDRESGYLVFGAGTYPVKGLADGYMCLVRGGHQRNLRFSQHLEGSAADGIGPFRWKVGDDGEIWRMFLGPNPAGVEFDLTWTARAPAFVVEEYRAEDASGTSAYAHWFQSGRYEGSLSVDGESLDVSGFFGERDRSRGSRRMRDRLGMHMWLQAQMPEESIGLLFNLDRAGGVAHCEGAILGEDGGVLPISGVRHDVSFADDFELEGGRISFEAGGRRRELGFGSTGRGLYMEGGGYAGWHGVDHGESKIEHDLWALDGSRNPRNLTLGITDALCRFDLDGTSGSGILEYAVTRSPDYAYEPDAWPEEGSD